MPQDFGKFRFILLCDDSGNEITSYDEPNVDSFRCSRITVDFGFFTISKR